MQSPSRGRARMTNPMRLERAYLNCAIHAGRRATHVVDQTSFRVQLGDEACDCQVGHLTGLQRHCLQRNGRIGPELRRYQLLVIAREQQIAVN